MTLLVVLLWLLECIRKSSSQTQLSFLMFSLPLSPNPVIFQKNVGKITALWSISGVSITAEHWQLIFFWKARGSQHPVPFLSSSFPHGDLLLRHTERYSLQSSCCTVSGAYALQGCCGSQMWLKVRRKKLRLNLESVFLPSNAEISKESIYFSDNHLHHSLLSWGTLETLVIQIYLDMPHK